MNVRTFGCSPIVPCGAVTGPALVSTEAICFYLVEPDTGVVVESDHQLFKKSMKDTVLVAHSGKGSSVVQSDGLYKIAQKGTGPVAVILRNPDPVFVSALLVMETPSVYDVDEEFYSYVREGHRVTVDPQGGTVTVEG